MQYKYRQRVHPDCFCIHFPFSGAIFWLSSKRRAMPLAIQLNLGGSTSVEEVIVKSARMESPLEEQEQQQDILSLKIGFCALSIVSCKAGYAFG